MASRTFPQSVCRDCGADFPNAQTIRELESGRLVGSVVIPGPPKTCPACGAVPTAWRGRAA